MLTQLLLPPLFLAAWGAELYGEWLTVFALVGYLQLVDAGIQAYSINILTHASRLSDEQSYDRTLNTSVGVVNATAGAAILLAMLLGHYVPWGAWFDLAQLDERRVAAVVSLLGIYVAVSLVREFHTGLYRSVGKYARGVHIRNLSTVVLTGAVVFVVISGLGPVSVASTYALIAFLEILFIRIDLRRKDELRIPVLSRPDLRDAWALFLPSTYFLGVQLSSALAVQGAAVLVNVLFGAAAVASFAVLRTLGHVARQGMGVLNAAIWPEVTAFAATGDEVRMALLHSIATKIFVTFSVACSSYLLVAGEATVSVWIRDPTDIYSAPLVRALAVLLIVQGVWLSSSGVLAAVNAHGTLALAYLVASIGGMALATALAPVLGVSGVVYGLAIGDLLLAAWWIPYRVTVLIGTSMKYHIRTVLMSLAYSALAAGSVAIMLAFMPQLAALPMAVFTGLSVCLTFALAGYCTLSADERRLFNGMLHRSQG